MDLEILAKSLEAVGFDPRRAPAAISLDLLRCIIDSSRHRDPTRSMRAGRVKGLCSSCRAPLRVSHRRPDTRGVSPQKNPGRRPRLSRASRPFERYHTLENFNGFGLAEPLVKALAKMGYQKPTPIQAQAIPALMQGRDLLGIAQTGTGKTAAFALPILHKLLADPRPAPKLRRARAGAQPDPRTRQPDRRELPRSLGAGCRSRSP